MRFTCIYSGNSVFPQYREGAVEYVTDGRRFALAKMCAVAVFRRNRGRIQDAFRKHCVRFETARFTFDPVWRIQTATLAPMPSPLLGLTDGVQIEISDSIPMQFAELVGVLIHEALHTHCRVRGRALPVHVEHRCMKSLGDQCQH